MGGNLPMHVLESSTEGKNRKFDVKSEWKKHKSEIDCNPGLCEYAAPVPLPKLDESEIYYFAKRAIVKYNLVQGTEYRFQKILEVKRDASGRWNCMTFTARKHSYDLKRFRALVWRGMEKNDIDVAFVDVIYKDVIPPLDLWDWEKKEPPEEKRQNFDVKSEWKEHKSETDWNPGLCRFADPRALRSRKFNRAELSYLARRAIWKYNFAHGTKYIEDPKDRDDSFILWECCDWNEHHISIPIILFGLNNYKIKGMAPPLNIWDWDLETPEEKVEKLDARWESKEVKKSEIDCNRVPLFYLANMTIVKYNFVHGTGYEVEEILRVKRAAAGRWSCTVFAAKAGDASKAFRALVWRGMEKNDIYVVFVGPVVMEDMVPPLDVWDWHPRAPEEERQKFNVPLWRLLAYEVGEVLGVKRGPGGRWICMTFAAKAAGIDVAFVYPRAKDLQVLDLEGREQEPGYHSVIPELGERSSHDDGMPVPVQIPQVFPLVKPPPPPLPSFERHVRKQILPFEFNQPPPPPPPHFEGHRGAYHLCPFQTHLRNNYLRNFEEIQEGCTSASLVGLRNLNDPGLKEFANLAIEKFNIEKDTNYVLQEILRVNVMTAGIIFMYHMTFLAKADVIDVAVVDHKDREACKAV